MPLVQSYEVGLHCEVYGDGEPVIFIPGFGNGLWIWFKQVPFFAERFRTVVFDPRGISRSEKPEGSVTVAQLAKDVEGLLGALNLESAHIVGASFGGFVAQEFALAYPEQVRSLTLSCTSFGGIKHVMPSPETLQAMASTKGLNTEERVRQNLLLAFSPDFLQNKRSEVEQIIELRAANPVPEYAYLQQLQAAISFSTEERVESIAVPTLVITGDADVIVPPVNSKNLAAKIPHAELRIVTGGSHTYFIEQAEEFNEIVSGFIRDNTARRSLEFGSALTEQEV
jgi:pimeloyl-ACP methyl ester carboxylesterase